MFVLKYCSVLMFRIPPKPLVTLLLYTNAALRLSVAPESTKSAASVPTVSTGAAFALASVAFPSEAVVPPVTSTLPVVRVNAKPPDVAKFNPTAAPVPAKSSELIVLPVIPVLATSLETLVIFKLYEATDPVSIALSPTAPAVPETERSVPSVTVVPPETVG